MFSREFGVWRARETRLSMAGGIVGIIARAILWVVCGSLVDSLQGSVRFCCITRNMDKGVACFNFHRVNSRVDVAHM